MNDVKRLAPLAFLIVSACTTIDQPSPGVARDPTPGPTRSMAVATPAPTHLPLGPQVQAAGLIDAASGWALTSDGLYFTGDGGGTWRSAVIPGIAIGRGVLGVTFVDVNRGWLATLDSDDPASRLFDIWGTSDGARTWSKVVVPEGANFSDTMGDVMFDVHDASRLVAFVEGGMPNGYVSDLYSTTDGGGTWSLDGATSDGVVGAVAFIDRQHGFVAGGAPGNRLYRTVDGGVTWSQEALPAIPGADSRFSELWDPPRFWDVRAGALVVVYGTSERAVAFGILGTADAGATWSIRSGLAIPEGSGNAHAAALLSPSTWVIALPAGSIATTHDGGARWTTVQAVGLAGVPDTLSMPDESHAWALVPLSVCLTVKNDCEYRTGLYATSDGGATWKPLWPGKT